MSLEEFLGHSTRGGGGGQYLEDWKKDGSIIVWLHRKAPFYAVWQHPWQRIAEVEDRDTGAKTRKVFGQRWACHERELILRKQRFRGPDDNREYPPETCPVCIMIEVVRELVNQKKLSIAAPVFEFEAEDPRGTRVLHAGGLSGLFGKPEDLRQDELAEIRRAQISMKDAWRENVIAGCKYLFCVVNNADPSAGVAVATEASILGEKMQKTIRDEIRRAGKNPDRGNPSKRPYPFEWQYHDEKQFNERYHVVALDPENYPPTKAIQDLIDGDPPDVSSITNPGNCAAMRTSMEAHAVVDLPWDRIFGPSSKLGLLDPAKSPPKQMNQGQPAALPQARPSLEQVSRAAQDTARVHVVRNDSPPQTQPESRVVVAPPVADDDTFECDHCKGPMLADDIVCKHCGTEYAQFNGQVRIAIRPCSACKTPISIDAKDARVICPKCAAIHEVETWEVIREEPKAAAPKRSRTAKKSAVDDDIKFP